MPNDQAPDEATLRNDEASDEIVDAVAGRHRAARSYVMHLRRANPDASPAQIWTMIDRRYVTAVTTAGTSIRMGGTAFDVLASLIPAGKAAKAAKGLTRAASVAGGLAGNVMPASDKKAEFALTALYAWALVDLHGMSLDDAEVEALVLTLTADDQAAEKGPAAADGTTIKRLASQVAGAKGRGAAAGANALVNGVSTFTFGRDVVIRASRLFPAVPVSFPRVLAFENNPAQDDPALIKALEGWGKLTATVGQTAKTTGNAAVRTAVSATASVLNAGASAPKGHPGIAAARSWKTIRNLGKGGKS